jgi:signal transduction histidine kinase
MGSIETTKQAAGAGQTPENVSGNISGNISGSVRGRAQAYAETLAAARYRGESGGESLSGLAHDARNMVMALELYCDLLEEPGVLSIACRHYAAELRLVSASSRRLVEKLALMGKRQAAGATKPVALSLDVLERPIPESFILDLREELLAGQNLLDALAGPSISVTVSAPEGAQPVWLTTEDLTRVLVNLVKNAAEAIAGAISVAGAGADSTGGTAPDSRTASGRGRIEISLRERAGSADAPAALLVAVEDSGPGIDPGQLEAIFEPGFTTNSHTEGAMKRWPAAHRGLGLFICRSIVEAAGGRMLAGNRGQFRGQSGGPFGEQSGGARIEIELPVRGN